MRAHSNAIDAPHATPCCDACGGFLHLEVREGAWGPIVSSRCETCGRARAPYEGQGAREAIFAARARDKGHA